jgi:hypothetical protein
MNKQPATVRVALFFLLLNALVWLLFAVIIATNAHPSIPDIPLIKWGMGILSFLLTAIFLTLYVFLSRQNRMAWFIAISILILTALVTIFDDFGLIDFVVLIINLIPLVLLIKEKDWYIKGKPNTTRSQ